MTGTIVGTVRLHRRDRERREGDYHATPAPASPARSTTDEAGEYTAPSLPTGTYLVTGGMAGSRPRRCRASSSACRSACASTSRLELGADDRVGHDRGRDPAAADVLLGAGTTVVEEQIQTLPLNGRNFVSLTRTVPGVLRGIPGANIDGAGSLAWRASASFSANGQRARDNNYMLDGVDNNETWLQTVVLFPSVDSLDEFKLQTSTYSAEFGRSLGGVVNLQIKSGTNSYRGSGYEFHRNDAFDANNFFNNRAGRAEARLQSESVRRHTRRARLQGQDFLLLRLPGAPRRTGPDVPVDRPVGADAPGEFLGADAADLRSGHRPAISGQHHPVQPLGFCLDEHPQRAVSPSRIPPARAVPAGSRSTTT